MRTITYKKTIAASGLPEETAFNLKVQQQYGSAFVILPIAPTLPLSFSMCLRTTTAPKHMPI